jgi:hypothetical protein
MRFDAVDKDTRLEQIALHIHLKFFSFVYQCEQSFVVGAKLIDYVLYCLFESMQNNYSHSCVDRTTVQTQGFKSLYYLVKSRW